MKLFLESADFQQAVA